MNPVEYFDRAADRYDLLGEARVWKAARRAEQAALFRLAGPCAGFRVLELGAGSGYYASRFVAAGAIVLATDASPAMVEQARAKGLEAMVGRIGALHLERKFDLVLAAGVAEFLEQPEALFQTAFEHSLPHAQLLLLFPRGGLRGAAYEWWHRRRGCPAWTHSARKLELAARAHGWKLERAEGAGLLAQAALFRRAGNGVVVDG